MRTQISPNSGPALVNPVMGLVHTSQGARTDESLGNFCANPSAGVSYGYGVDDDSVTLMVPETLQSWSALGANRFAIHICLTGFAEWSEAEWMSHPVMLSQTADLIREISTRRGWPIRHLTADQIRNHEGGWAGHGDYSVATGDGDHWDPGPNFPWAYVLGLAAGTTTEGDDDVLDADQSNRLTEAWQDAAAAKDGVTNVAAVVTEIRNLMLDPNIGLFKQVGTLSGQIAGIKAAQSGVDLAGVEAAAEKGAKDALSGVTLLVQPPAAT